MRILAAGLVIATIALPAAAQNPTPRPAAPQTPARDNTVGPPAGTGVIEGTVTTGSTARPVRRARVTVSGGEPRVARSTTTDDRGAFSFSQLPAGQFVISATRLGYLDVMYGQKRPGSGRPGTPVQLAAGQHIERLALQMPRTGVLTGLIIDEFSDPAAGATVRALRYVRRSGERVLQIASTAQSDDRGIYRIAGLLPGEYVVNVTPREADAAVSEKMQMEEVAVAKMKAAADMGVGAAIEDMQKMLDQMASTAGDPSKEPTSGYAPVYYPATTSIAGATSLTIDIAEEKTNIDLQLQVVPLGRLTGVVTHPDGQVPPGTQILLIDPALTALGLGARTTRPGADGRFTFAVVSHGQYSVVARSAGGVMVTPAGGGGAGAVKLTSTAPSNQYYATADVSVDSRNSGSVTLAMQPGLAASGQVIFDGPTPTDLSRLRLSLNPMGPGAAVDLGAGIRPVGIDADGRFTFVGAVPGRYRIAVANTLPGWSLKSAVVAGQDIVDIPLEIKSDNVTGAIVTLTTRTTDLSGTLHGPTGDPSADYTIVVFPSDSRYWLPQARRIQATRPSTAGRFSFRDLPPGDYRLAAVSDVEPGAWFDPAFLRQLLGSSIAVMLGEGERRNQDITISR